MEQNFCRICFKFFCCFKCRMKHEKAIHHLKPLASCDICRYGRIYFNCEIKDDSDLIIHINEQHSMLHCHKCKMIFNNVTDLLKTASCEGKLQPEVKDSQSLVLSGNNMKKVKCNDTEPPMKTSTPMGANSNIAGREYNVEIISPTESHYISSNDSNQIFENITPINNYNVPLITPRSIMSNNKSHRDSTGRHVTFSDMVKDSRSSDNSNLLSYTNRNENKSKRYFFRGSTIATFDLSPSTPSSSQAEIFYTPEGRISDWIMEPDTENRCEKAEEEKSLGLKGIFDSISKVFSTVIKSVFKPEENEQEFYMNTSGSIKRFLSPNADQTVPKLKRLCVRGRRPITRTNFSLN